MNLNFVFEVISIIFCLVEKLLGIVPNEKIRHKLLRIFFKYGCSHIFDRMLKENIYDFKSFIFYISKRALRYLTVFGFISRNVILVVNILMLIVDMYNKRKKRRNRIK